MKYFSKEVQGETQAKLIWLKIVLLIRMVYLYLIANKLFQQLAKVSAKNAHICMCVHMGNKQHQQQRQ